MVDRQHPHRGAVEEYLRLVDAQFKTLLERLGPDFTTMIVSDHGFGSIDKVLNLNTWLLQEGYIKIRPTWLARARRAFWKAGITGNAELLLLHRIFMGLQAKGWVNFIGARAGFELLVRRFNLSFSFNDIDWPRTKCWAPPGLGQMMINLKGREPQGCVAPEEYEQLRQELIGKLKSLTDPENGRPLNLEVYTREEAYHGNQSHLATDLVIYGNETGYFVYDSRHFHRPTPIYRNNCFPSSHRRAGIFLMKGSNIRPGRQIHGARMIDIAPTILHLFQQPIPAEMDGQVLGDVFENIGNIAHQQATGADTHPDQSIRISEEDEAMIQARLRGLGYID
jgi:predicted AlkP superfamily phosphohydrolase/phosphomutase